MIIDPCLFLCSEILFKIFQNMEAFGPCLFASAEDFKRASKFTHASVCLFLYSRTFTNDDPRSACLLASALESYKPQNPPQVSPCLFSSVPPPSPKDFKRLIVDCMSGSLCSRLRKASKVTMRAMMSVHPFGSFSKAFQEGFMVKAVCFYSSLHL
jgi:hypothetical protein